ncbi:MAG: hypothetical protein Q7R66_07770 [Undibacterium sp.]|uniref:hypothetical protein n=1 Tax=Undibacterium sp. TaxID=1914977 RepID=UPI00271E8962|nr:hypothetical protein [Undibacterium sp.]MDO8652071.1 hypothetical protein [Undibacterium sp.]
MNKATLNALQIKANQFKKLSKRDRVVFLLDRFLYFSIVAIYVTGSVWWIREYFRWLFA